MTPVRQTRTSKGSPIVAHSNAERISGDALDELTFDRGSSLAEVRPALVVDRDPVVGRISSHELDRHRAVIV